MSPLLSTFAGASARPYGWLQLAGGYFFALNNTTGTYTTGVSPSSGVGSLTLDSGKNIWWNNASNATSSFVKTTNNGVLLYQKQHAINAGPINGLNTDSSGNYYYAASNSLTSNSMIAWKVDGTGTTAWQRAFQTVGNNSACAKVAASGNVYFRVTATSTLSGHHIVKFSSAGATTWQRKITVSSNNESQSGDLVFDSSENIYSFGDTNATTPITTAFKYNSSGTIQWQVAQTTAAFSTAIDVSSAGDSVVISNSSGTAFATINKFNTTGVLQWTRKLSTGTSVFGRGVSIDQANGDIYVLATNGNNLIIIKYNSAGTIQWQRSLVFGASANSGGRILVDENAIYVAGGTTTSASTSQAYLCKLPKDGSLTGTYTVGSFSVTYGTSTLTDAASGITWSAGTGTESAGTGTITTSTDTFSTPTFTLTTKAIP